jgi:osmotically-inducible protein OsmY
MRCTKKSRENIMPHHWRDDRYRGRDYGDWESGRPVRQTGNWSGMRGEGPRHDYPGQREFSDDYPSYGSQYGRDRDYGYPGRRNFNPDYNPYEYEPYPTGRRTFAPGYGHHSYPGDYRGASYGFHEDRYGRYGNPDRGWWDRASDEVSSWFGDDEAQRRREMDEMRDHRGRGPKGYKRSDQRIHEDVSDRLTDDSWLDASDIEVRVKDGEVTLTGTVDSRAGKYRAEMITESCSGVSEVQNNLRVTSHTDSPSTYETTGAGRMKTRAY